MTVLRNFQAWKEIRYEAEGETRFKAKTWKEANYLFTERGMAFGTPRKGW